MKIITLEESKKWLTSHGFSNRESEFPSPRGDFVLPADSGRKTALAKTISGMFDDGDEVLLVVLAWDIWPSSSSMALFDIVRLSFSESRPLEEAPGHLFAAGESDSIESFLALTLYFVWEAVLVGSKSRLSFWVSHDEWFSVHLADAEAFQRTVDWFESVFKLAPRTPSPRG